MLWACFGFVEYLYIVHKYVGGLSAKNGKQNQAIDVFLKELGKA